MQKGNPADYPQMVGNNEAYQGEISQQQSQQMMMMMMMMNSMNAGFHPNIPGMIGMPHSQLNMPIPSNQQYLPYLQQTINKEVHNKEQGSRNLQREVDRDMNKYSAASSSSSNRMRNNYDNDDSQISQDVNRAIHYENKPRPKTSYDQYQHSEDHSRQQMSREKMSRPSNRQYIMEQDESIMNASSQSRTSSYVPNRPPQERFAMDEKLGRSREKANEPTLWKKTGDFWTVAANNSEEKQYANDNVLNRPWMSNQPSSASQKSVHMRQRPASSAWREMDFSEDQCRERNVPSSEYQNKYLSKRKYEDRWNREEDSDRSELEYIDRHESSFSGLKRQRTMDTNYLNCDVPRQNLSRENEVIEDFDKYNDRSFSENYQRAPISSRLEPPVRSSRQNQINPNIDRFSESYREESSQWSKTRIDATGRLGPPVRLERDSRVRLERDSRVRLERDSRVTLYPELSQLSPTSTKTMSYFEEPQYSRNQRPRSEIEYDEWSTQNPKSKFREPQPDWEDRVHPSQRSRSGIEYDEPSIRNPISNFRGPEHNREGRPNPSRKPGSNSEEISYQSDALLYRSPEPYDTSSDRYEDHNYDQFHADAVGYNERDRGSKYGEPPDDRDQREFPFKRIRVRGKKRKPAILDRPVDKPITKEKTLNEPWPPPGNVSVSIVPANFPLSILTKDLKLKAAADVLRIVRSQANQPFKPKFFGKTINKPGMLTIHCINQQVADWMVSIENKLFPCERTKLKVLKGSKRPRSLEFNLYFTGECITRYAAVKNLLEKDNPILNIAEWLVINKQEIGGSLKIKYSVDYNSMLTLLEDAESCDRKNLFVNYKKEKVKLIPVSRCLSKEELMEICNENMQKQTTNISFCKNRFTKINPPQVTTIKPPRMTTSKGSDVLNTASKSAANQNNSFNKIKLVAQTGTSLTKHEPDSQLSPEAKPKVSHNVNPKELPVAMPKVSPAAKPKISPAAKPKVSPAAKPKVSSVRPRITFIAKSEVSPSTSEVTSLSNSNKGALTEYKQQDCDVTSVRETKKPVSTLVERVTNVAETSEEVCMVGQLINVEEYDKEEELDFEPFEVNVCETEERLNRGINVCGKEEELGVEIIDCEQEEEFNLEGNDCGKEEILDEDISECEKEKELDVEIIDIEQEEAFNIQGNDCEEGEGLDEEINESETEEELGMVIDECEQEEEFNVEGNYCGKEEELVEEVEKCAEEEQINLESNEYQNDVDVEPEFTSDSDHILSTDMEPDPESTINVTDSEPANSVSVPPDESGG